MTYTNEWLALREEMDLPEPVPRPDDPIAACRAAGRDGSVRELRVCMEERSRRPPRESAATVPRPRRGRPDGSAWLDFLAESGDVREGETEAEASRRIVAAPEQPGSLAAELLGGA
jgi:hypothetical protein